MPERAYAEHSSSCQTDNTLLTDEDETIVECTCKPNAEAPPPDTFELWWCSWCGEPSVEWSDPCQECGEPITRCQMVAFNHNQEPS